MILNNLPSGDSCTNVTVYSECNTDRAEVGSYSSSSTDSNGYSIFTSDDGSLYKIYYDSSSSVMITIHYKKSTYFLTLTVLQVWAIGMDGSSSTVTSSSSYLSCPNEVNGWSFVDSTEV